MRKNIDELMSQAAQMLAELGYKPSTVEHYERTWQKVKQWCVERQIAWFGVDEEHQLLEAWGLHENVLSPSSRSMLRHIRTLRSLAEDGSLPAFSQARPEDVPVQFQEVFEAYSSHL
ncbi:hypothetical protein, partial [Yaniella flava]|uniref:hypothetical protein n=1 Tax=Yaniella flava TaxID=287930 RepID=UPI0031D7A2FB